MLKFIEERLAVMPEFFVLSAVLATGSDIFKAEKESLQKQIDEFKAELSGRQSSESDAKLVEFSQKYDANIRALHEELRVRDLYIKGLQ